MLLFQLARARDIHIYLYDFAKYQPHINFTADFGAVAAPARAIKISVIRFVASHLFWYIKIADLLKVGSSNP